MSDLIMKAGRCRLGDGADECPECKRMALHVFTNQCMACGFKAEITDVEG